MNEISDIGSVRSLVDQLLQRNICDVVLSPGSRNAPFIIAFNAIDTFRCQSVLDERSAGFIGLGMAQQSGQPVVLSCTSGSAVLNYAPALVEAYYQRIPLIAITADRPAAWIDQGEGQSIRQVKLLDQVVIKACYLVEEHSDTDHWHNLRMISETLETAIATGRPVQINVPLSEPLYGTQAYVPSKSKGFAFAASQSVLTSAAMESLQRQWNSARKIMVIATQGAASMQRPLSVLSADARVAVLTESMANLPAQGLIACIDRTLERFIGSEAEEDYIPDLLITVGGNIVSKKIKALLRKYRAQITHHWHFGDEVADTFQSLSQLIDAAPSSVLSSMVPSTEVREGAFGHLWKARYYEAEQLHEAFLADCPFSDLAVYRSILDFIPDHAVLQLGNSSVVRYVQLFNPLANVRYFCNRGVSGIEGCTSTAVGAALTVDGLTVLISGDQAFRYDSNALLQKEGIEKLRIIVINNGGGNIFRIIDGPSKHSVSEKFIEKKDETSVEKLVAYHEVDYLSAGDFESLEASLTDLLHPERKRCAVLEIMTPRIQSPEVLKSYFSHIRKGA